MLVKPIVKAKLQYGLPRVPGEPGGFSWVIIGPSLFFDSNLRSKQSMLEKEFFDEPLGSKGVSRVGLGDIALAVANALQDKGKVWASKKVMVGSLERYTNIEVAKLWSDALVIAISPANSSENGLAEFEEHYRPKVGLVWARDMRLMYDSFEADGFSMDETEYQD